MKSHVRSEWTRAVLVCRKCSRKIDGGFGPDGDLSLAKALKRRGGGRKRKAAFGVIEVPCLGICPKDAVVAIDTARPADWVLVRPGTPMDAVETALGLVGQDG